MSTSNFSSTPTSTGTPDAIRDTNTISLSDVARSKTFLNWTRPLPTYIVPSSRGSVPHLTPDNLHQHTKIPSIHIGLEDFISPPPAKSPIFGIQTSLQKYLAYPDSTTVVFAARRANPVPINSSWNDKIEINTVDGRNTLPVEIFINAIQQVKLRQQDIVIGIPDTTESPGVKRLGKMVERTQGWLEMLLKTQPECKVYASIPPIPPARGPALLDDYMDFLSFNASKISGIALYNIFPDHPITHFLPEELSHLPILLVPSPVTPHDILAGIISDQVGTFTAGGMITSMSDLGIALNFKLDPPSTTGDKLSLGKDLFSTENEAVMGPLVDDCQCFTCKNHFRAYIHHLLKCHEMTAWVLLQIHNFHVLDRFFEDIGRAIENGTLLSLVEKFDLTYSTEDIIEAGSRGPRVRGHHTALRREQKKRKLPVAQNKGIVGKEVSILSGGEVIEREGKRKHWKQFEEGITDEGMEMLDEEENVEGELLPDGEVEMMEENGVKGVD